MPTDDRGWVLDAGKIGWHHETRPAPKSVTVCGVL